MKLIEWKTIKNGLKKLLNFHSQKEYLSILVDNIEKQRDEDNNLPFKITGIRENGFTVKVAGLYAYVPFNHMPWKYGNIEAWKAVYPTIIGKILFCKVYEVRKDPLYILINGEIPQFKKPELIENIIYKGIIINKTYYGVFVDIGYSFKWKCGSLVGLLHKSNFEPAEFEKTETGHEIELHFWGYNEKGQLIFGNKSELKEWFTGEIAELVGETVPVNILRPNNTKINFLVKGKYNATLSVSKTIYPGNKTQIKKAVRNLKNEDLIHCKVIKVNSNYKTLQLKWDLLPEIEDVIARGARNITQKIRNKNYLIQNRIDNEIVQKLNLIEKIVKVEVIKKENKWGKLYNQYLVENKYRGKLFVSNDNYRISEKAKKLIEQNLYDGEIINCEVLSIEKKLIHVKWNLKDEELFEKIEL